MHFSLVEDERMGKPPVSPKVPITNSKAEPNHIKVRYLVSLTRNWEPFFLF
jgi:hypothetical protein